MPENTRSSERDWMIRLWAESHAKWVDGDGTAPFGFVNNVLDWHASKVEEARIDTLERLRLVCANCQRMTNFMEADLRNFKNGLCGNCGADALKADFQSIRSEIQALQSKEGEM